MPLSARHHGQLEEDVVALIEGEAAAVDAAKGHHALADDHEDRHAVLNKSAAQIKRIRQLFASDAEKRAECLHDWLQVPSFNMHRGYNAGI